jgi:hypothetical protein
MEGSPYHCPKCQADSTQSIKMLFQTGIQHGVSRTAMGGVGFGGGGLGVAVGTASTASSSSMALIRKYQMPPRPMVSDTRKVVGILSLVGAGFLALPLVAMRGNAESGELPFILFILIATGLTLGSVLLGTFPGYKRVVASEQARWDARHAYLDRTWVCFRCGAEWQPES